jgi:ACS family glucarate transporter-like MFS transporter
MVEIAAPTRARHVTLLFVVLLALITYMDRVAISVAAADIRKDLGLSLVQMGWALSVFGWAYALFEIPGGWLGDRIGPRRVLMRIVLWWSFFTAFTGWAWSPRSLIITRALFGAGEAGAFPNLTRILRPGCRPANASVPRRWSGWPRA